MFDNTERIVDDFLRQMENMPDLPEPIRHLVEVWEVKAESIKKQLDFVRAPDKPECGAWREYHALMSCATQLRAACACLDGDPEAVLKTLIPVE